MVCLLAGCTADASPDATRKGDGRPGGECRTDADCPVAGMAPESVCVMNRCEERTFPPRETCGEGGLRGQCCSDADCTDRPRGHCVAFSHRYCGGAAPPPTNECRYDACSSDAECTEKPNGFCSGGYPRACVYGPCRTNADCTRSPGGRCVMDTVNLPCPRLAVFCRYPGDPCRLDADCKADARARNGMVCTPNADLHGTACTEQLPPLP